MVTEPSGFERDAARAMLTAKKASVLAAMTGKMESLLRVENAAEEDLAPVFHDQFLALQLNQIDCVQLNLIDEALDRLKLGGYGVCMDCEEEISYDALKAGGSATCSLNAADEIAGCPQTVAGDSLGGAMRSLRGGLGALTQSRRVRRRVRLTCDRRRSSDRIWSISPKRPSMRRIAA